MLTNYKIFLTAPPPLTAFTTSADETACTQQPCLRPGCCLHTVSSSYVVVVCGPLTPCLCMAMYSPRIALHYSDQGHPMYRHFTCPAQPCRATSHHPHHPPCISHPSPGLVLDQLTDQPTHTRRKTRSSPNLHLNPHLKLHALGVGVGV